MIISVDETGDFKAGAGRNFGLVILTSITDSGYDKFLSFLDKVFPSGYVGIKGNTIAPKQRKIILNYIGHKPDIKYTAFLYDLAGGTEEWVEKHRSGQLEKIKQSVKEKEKLLTDSYLKDINLLINQVAKYSTADYSKFVMFFELFMKWQRFFMFDYITTDHNKDSWDMHFVIDTQGQSGKFLRLLEAYLILTTHNNPKFSIVTPEELGIDHPYVVKYAYKNNVNLHDGKKFFSDLRIGDDKKEPSLLLPDLIGHVIQRSINEYNNGLYLKDLYKLRKNRSIIQTITNPNAYFTIYGFDRTRNKKDTALLLKKHHYYMRKFEYKRR